MRPAPRPTPSPTNHIPANAGRDPPSSYASPTNPIVPAPPRSAAGFPGANPTPYARPAPNPTPSPTNYIPVDATPDPYSYASTTNPAPPSGRSNAVSSSTNSFAPYAGRAPSATPTSSNRAPVTPTPDPRFLSSPSDFVRNPSSTSSSSVSHTNSVPTSASNIPNVPPKSPRSPAMYGTSNTSFSRTPDSTVGISSGRQAVNVVNDTTSRTHMPGPSTSGFEPSTIADIVPVVERRATPRHSPQPTTPITASPSFTNTAGPSSSRVYPPNPSTSGFDEHGSDLDDIIQAVERSVH